MSVDVVVVGGGLAGMTAAALLARAGRGVVVLEGAGAVGGRASTDETRGYRFDRGAHALFLGGPAERVLRQLGAMPPGRRAFTDGSVVVRGGATHPLPDGLAALVGASWLGAGGRLALAGWLARVGAGLAPAGGTAEEWLAALPGEVRAVAAALTRVSTYSGDLHRMDARFAAAAVAQGVRRGVFYVEGGWQVLVDGLRAVAEAAGAQVRVAAAARAVRPGAVETDEGVVAARDVVLAVPPDRARALGAAVPEGPAPSRVAAWQLALRDDVVTGPRRLVLDADRSVFLSNFSPVVRMGPPGCQVVHGIRYLVDDRAEDARADVEATLTDVWPRWRDGVVADRWLPSMVTHPCLPEPGRGRPAIDAVPGLWLAGDGYGPDGHLADAAVATAEAVAVQLTAKARATAA